MTVIGTVDLRAFDKGVLMALEPDLATFTVDGEARQAYVVPVDGVDSGITNYDGKVPVWFVNPEDVYSPAYLPSIRIAQPDMTPAFDRQPWYDVVGRKAGDDAVPVTLPDGRTGYTTYESQWRATPFDLTYDVTLLGRRREDASAMLLYAMRRLKAPWFSVPVVDTLGDTRNYDAGELGISNISEIVDITDRVVGWTMSFTVRAELDLDDSMTGRTFTGASALDPSDPLYSCYDLILRTHAGLPAEG